MNAAQFISGAIHRGPCVGVTVGTANPALLPERCELRIIEGAHTKTRGAVYQAFAEAWHFPPWFGRNMDAFDDFMRDLDNMINTACGKPPAPGYLTQITDAHLLLVDEPDAFSWFAECMPFYRDYYRDEASPPAAFGLLLSAPSDRLPKVLERWETAGIAVATVHV